MKVGKEFITKKIADVLEMPKDIVYDLPRITMIGSSQVIIENHRGIIEYSSNMVRIGSCLGEICICGENMMIKNILTEEINIEGKINGLTFA